MKRLPGVALGALVLVATSCGSQTSTPKPHGSGTGGRLNVAASVYPVYDSVAAVGSTRVHAINLLPTGALANLPLSAKATEELRTADIAVILGGGTQPEVERVAAQRTGPTIKLLDSIDTTSVVAGEMATGTVDPYVWLDPQRMVQVADRVSAAINSSDPDGRTLYAKHLKRYKKMLTMMDRNYRRGLASCASTNVVVERPQFHYLTSRYGLTQVWLGAQNAAGVGLGIAAKAMDPAASTVFLGALPDIGDARKLLDKYQLKAAVLDPLSDQTDQARRGGSNYAAMMGLNLDALKAGLGCAKPSGGK